MKNKKQEKPKQTKQAQITMPPEYWRAIDKRVKQERAFGRTSSRSAIIRLALDLMEW